MLLHLLLQLLLLLHQWPCGENPTAAAAATAAIIATAADDTVDAAAMIATAADDTVDDAAAAAVAAAAAFCYCWLLLLLPAMLSLIHACHPCTEYSLDALITA